MTYFEYDDYAENEYYEPTTIDGLETAIKLEASTTIDVAAIEVLIRQYVQNNLRGILTSYIQSEVKKCIEGTFRSKTDFKEALESVMEKKFDEKYPAAVDESIDAIAQKIKKFEFGWKNPRNSSSLSERAEEKIKDYIDKELVNEVKKTTDWLEQYSRNYFANNLFRAMGMIDKMLPQADFDANRG